MCKGKQNNAIPACPAHVEAAIREFPYDIANTLFQIRELIYETHVHTKNVGDLYEDLRWGQPSFLTRKPVTGSTFRLGTGKCGSCALFFHCQSMLIERFRAQYLHLFNFEGNRALILTSPINTTREELSHCIAQALTYKVKAAVHT